jgi:hypothetical protein
MISLCSSLVETKTLIMNDKGKLLERIALLLFALVVLKLVYLVVTHQASTWWRSLHDRHRIDKI